MSPSPVQLALGGVALLALSLAGVPLFLGREAQGSLRGVVVDGRGFGVADAAVFLFSEEHLQLVEETSSDDDGDFVFHLDAERPRVFVRPPSARGLLSAWGPSQTADGLGGVARTLALVLRPARSLEVEVRDRAGNPVVGAEVRVYERRVEAAVLALADTDGAGRVTLSAPAEADVAVLAPDGARLARWRFDLAVPQEGAQLAFTLPPSVPLRGRVHGAAGPLAGIVVVAWEEGIEGGWNGFDVSDEEGGFELPWSEAPTVVRAMDPSGAYLPGRLRVVAPPASALELTLERGLPLVVRTTRAGLPIGTRVWGWSPSAEAWGWGALTSASGRATVPVAPRFGIHAEPLDPAFGVLEAWDVPYRDGVFPMEAVPAP